MFNPNGHREQEPLLPHVAVDVWDGPPLIAHHASHATGGDGVKVGSKIFIITLGAIGFLIVVFFSFCSVLLVGSFVDLEEENTQILTAKACDQLTSEVQSLDASTTTFAYWDETYEFALGHNENYTQRVLPSSTFSNLDINTIIITNASGKILTRLCYDSGGTAQFPIYFYDHLKEDGLLLTQGKMREGVKGVVMVGNDPYIVAAHPILPNDQTGEPAGTFIMGRKINDRLLEKLSREAIVPVSIYDIRWSVPDLPEGSKDLVTSQSVLVRPYNDTKILGFIGVRDIYGEEALIIRVDATRSLYQQALDSQNDLLTMLLLLSVFPVAVTVFFLRFLVTSRLGRLDDGVRRIEEQGGSGRPLDTVSNDELGNLASSINRMVSSLEASKRDLLESERRYKAVVEDQTELVVRMDPRGGITFANAAFIKHYGPAVLQSNEAAKGFLPVPPSEYANVHSKLAAITPDGPVFEHEHEFRNSDEEVRWFQWTVRGIFGDGVLSEVQWVGRDVTERMRLLEKLNKTDKIESLGVFAGGIAHDFNNYLTAIMGTVNLMKRSLSPTDPRHRRLAEAERSVMKATELTKQLLTFSKGGEPIKRTISLPTFVRETAEFALRGSDIALSVSFEPGLVPVEADEGQLFQVISNLIINAKQAMTDGGTLYVRGRNVDIDESSTVPLPGGRYAVLSIADEGSGIPKELLGKIFDPFFTTKRNGTGLGLTIVHSIVARHGGHIEVDSEVGRGTEFRIYFPASPHDLEEEERMEEAPSHDSGRILLMDDEDAILEVGSELLRLHGYTVDTAADGEEAVAKYRQARASGEPFDVVIMDLTIRGGMGGKEAIQRLQEIDPEVRAIVSSGYSNDPVMANYRDHGFMGMVRKPYVIKDMLDTVYRLIHLNDQDVLSDVTTSGSAAAREAGE